MEHSTVFLRLRTIAFAVTTFICFVWIILLSCLLFIRWGISSQSERAFLVLFLLVDIITMILLPILILRKFRTWLDGARLLFLLICHIGLAVAFAVWTPNIPCPDRTPDDEGVCQLLNVYIIMASWIPPALLVAYGVCLSVYTWRYASRPRVEQSQDIEEFGDEESFKFRRDTLPIMAPEPPLSASWRNPLELAMNDGFEDGFPSRSRPSLVHTSRLPSDSSPVEKDDRASRKSRHTSGRLSKPLPAYFF
ncbi:hypothetical protein BV25DRAFT_672949 [Artomyces pyxidatus]|uniref:Uncharacterized protein n=1 Tax=Artomyces pyxidatus TaxID=48021 RepID=A0ACB8T0V5_9AGAM|nr:hypothetical protein BV25DRAFT_672949 [Artomyces pyxidatus]